MKETINNATMKAGVTGWAEGATVRVTEFGGRESMRRVVSDRGRIVLVCNEKEWESATREGRIPQGIGFPREYVAA